MARHLVHANYICSVYIADGFADDCDELIHRCSQVTSLSYEKFCDIWRDMEFACVFHGRPLCSELAELSEEVLQIAKHYMVANTDNFEDSVAGLFLVYGLLNLQPIAKFAYLRLIPEDVAAIERIQTVARRDRRLDVLYILGWVLIAGSHYHAVQRERGMEYPIRKYIEGYSSMDMQGIRPKGVFYRQNEELDIIKDLNRLSVFYKRSKENVVGPGSTERNLNYFNHNLAVEMGASLKNVINGIVDKNISPEETSGGESSRVQNIKEKAMRMPVKGIAHLTAVEDVIIPKGKKRSIKKRNDQTQVMTKRKRRRTVLDSTDSEDEEVSSDNNESVATKESEPTSNAGSVCEIEFIDQLPGKESNPTMPMLFGDKGLPMLIEPDEADNNEIAINSKQASQSKAVPEAGSSSGDPVESEESCATSTPDTSVVDMTVPQLSAFKRPNNKRIGKKDKRDLKKPRIKTKFQRMGMLPLANFLEDDTV